MLVRATRCFTDKTMNEKKGGVRWKGDVFEVTKKRADELFKHDAIEEVVDEPEPDPAEDDQADEANPDESAQDE